MHFSLYIFPGLLYVYVDLCKGGLNVCLNLCWLKLYESYFFLLSLLFRYPLHYCLNRSFHCLFFHLRRPLLLLL